MARRLLVLLVAVLAWSAWTVGSTQAQSTHEWIVNRDGDESGTCSASCTLRAAIDAANASVGPDVIRFERGMTIQPRSPLPPLAVPDVSIDASDLGGGADRAPVVWIDGTSAGDAAGIEIVAARATVRGLGISGFRRYGIGVVGAGASDALIESNWLGLSPDGLRAQPNQLSGVAVVGGAAGASVVGNRIAGNSVEGRTGHGIVIGGGGSVNAELRDNIIGIGTGGAALPNDDGILIVDSAQATVQGNVIGHSAVAGIEVRETRVPVDIDGNWIGIQRDGRAASNDVGIFLGPGSAAVRVGARAANVIAANRVGVAVEQGAREAQLWNNWIGLAPRGDGMARSDLPRARIAPNLERGISIIAGAANVRVVNNVVSAGQFGIVVADAHTSRVSLTRNVIAGARGRFAEAGIDVRAGTEIVIGGERGLGNHVCGAEVAVRLAQTEEASLRGNAIGPEAATQVTFDSDDRTEVGVELASGVVRAAVHGNQIAGASSAGIAVTGVDARDNLLTENSYQENGIDIDLGGDGATPNDAGDTDVGPNGLLNYPVIEGHDVTEIGFNQLRSTFSGVAAPGADVQVYALDGNRMHPIARTQRPADAQGHWEATTLELPSGSIRALAISGSRATSEFSPAWEPSRRVKLRSGMSQLVWQGPETAIHDAFPGAFGGAVVSVWRWDGAGQHWQGWAPAVPGAGLTRVRHGDVLHVEFRRGVAENFFMPPRGSAGGDSAVLLHAGLNEVSWLGPATDGIEALTAFDEREPLLLGIVWQWDSARNNWRVIWPRQDFSWKPPRWTAGGGVRLLIWAAESGLWLQRP